MSFESGAWKEEVDSGVSRNGVLKARFRQSRPNRTIARERSALDALLQLLGYYRLMSKYTPPSDREIGRKREGNVQAQKKMLKECSGEDLDIAQ